ncbi:LPS assembly lipoprotein LptE [Thiomicrorhabdus sp.]|uniref:LPS-assembly lipoprotein LptE n=1 Tax=Thiomicrorhabdus sp. TaxID=2039724 RepID=UPI0029C70297|nr:LPS assembly lipoprotein LptE [Thiomicrorhabdus sp.]
MTTKRSTRWYRFGFILVWAALLSACSFQLRGTGAQTGVLQKVYVEELDGLDYDLRRAILSHWPDGGIQLATSLKEAQVTVSLGQPEFRQRRTARSGQGDTTAELLSLSIAYSLYAEKNDRLLSAGRLQVQRDRQLQPDAVLASEAELKSLRGQMSQALADKLLFKVHSDYSTYLKARKGGSAQ